MTQFGGAHLIGKNVQMWKNGKYGGFLAKGVIVDCRKRQVRNRGHVKKLNANSYLIDFGGGKKFWSSRSNFEIIEN